MIYRGLGKTCSWTSKIFVNCLCSTNLEQNIINYEKTRNIMHNSQESSIIRWEVWRWFSSIWCIKFRSAIEQLLLATEGMVGSSSSSAQKFTSS